MTEVENILSRFGESRVDAIQNVLAQNRINASGRLSESVTYSVTKKGFLFTLEVTAFSYIFSALQEGRKPTENPGPGELRISIARWVDDKPIRFTDQREKQRFIYATTQKIHKEGTELYRKFGVNNQTTGELEKIFSNKEIEEIQRQLIETSIKEVSDSFVKFSIIE